ncbi:pyridoxal phosphate-dependent aminotransferase [Ornithinimicrobium avium]|uniref:Aminotransferase n=1 Tax=Ornithinimicrobium avium TaxID=2283195 RepID=A0A345NN25_9MICO|nr:pyridoxal phosphate-dependent aminotransferase [Ornithinimicrobium avium]AXH96433.1 pyridoxal phosphate-dependent aminotransferase [Ornithinimicrobium avium]
MTLSPIRRMALGAPEGTVSLALGEPGWPVPAEAREALATLSTQVGPLPYGPNGGSPELVAQVAAVHGAATSEVMLTAGSQAALFALFQTWAAPGSRVLVPDPGFVSYASLARLCGADPVPYRLGDHGDLDAEALVDALAGAPHTSMVVLNHPANPTGGMASPAALRAVAAACARAGAVLVSDEVYRELWLVRPPAGLHGAAGLGAGLVLGSVSKAFGAPGLRVGWAVGPDRLLAPARVVHNAMTTAAARPSQDAALALLRAREQVLPDAREQVRRRWETLARVAPRLLDAAGGRARAGFYLWLPLPEGVAAQDTETFALRVRDEGLVTTVPGTAFGARGRGHLRVSLGGPLPELEEGLARLAPWWEA